MPQDGKISDHLANERTFLAWIRTSIGIMGFGFVVVKFSIFVRQISLVLHKTTQDTSGSYSSVMGITLVAFGSLIGILAYFRYKRVERQINDPSYQPSGILLNILTFAILLIGVFLVAYLVQSV